MNASEITPDLVRIARWRAGFILECDHAVDDAVQNAFVQLISNGHPAQFLPRAAYWAAIKLVRRRREYQAPTDDDGVAIELAVTHAQPDEPMLNRERQEQRRNQVTSAVSSMTPRQRQVLSMKLAGNTHAAIGNRLGVTEQAASGACRRALQKLEVS